MKLTSEDAKNLGVVERIVSEKDLGEKPFYDRLREDLVQELEELAHDPDLVAKRYDRFRRIGEIKETV